MSASTALSPQIMSTATQSDAQIELREITRISAAKRSSKRRIRARIDKIIEKYQSRNRCKLSDEELVLLALAYSSDEWLLISQIGEFALSNIHFFQKQAASFFFGGVSYHAQAQSIHSLSRSTEDYLRTYGTPVHTRLEPGNQKAYSITAGAAYGFVETLYNKRHRDISVKGSSGRLLLDLPKELLLKIYHMVLKVSGFRLLVGNKTFVAHDDQVPIWQTRSQDALTMPPVHKLLALLSVNKEVYEDAMPEFYHQNHFQFRDMRSLKVFLLNIGFERRKHIRNVSFQYENLSVAAAGARLLAESENLQKLTLLMSAVQDPDGHFVFNSSRRKFSSLTQIPGFSSLKRLRGIQHLTFNPNLNHAILDAFLRPIITQPKVTNKAKEVKKTVKRKIDEFGHDTAVAKKSKSA